MPLPPKILCQGFGNPQDEEIRKKRKQELQMVQVVGTNRAARDEACGEFAEGRRRIGVHELEPPII